MERDYREERDGLLSVIEELLSIEAIPHSLSEELKEKLLENRFNLVVVGQFKRGKTTFINSLLGIPLLPTGVVPLTSIVTLLEYGDETEVKVFYNDGRIEEVSVGQLPDYVTEKGNPRNVKDVAEVVIKYPSEYLKDGVRLIDTPGVGSVYRHNTDVTYEYLPRSDATIFLISVDQPLSESELAFLKDIKSYSNRIFFLQNKSDYLTPDELKESLEFVKDVLNKEAGYGDVDILDIYPVSAKLSLAGKQAKDRELLERSGMPEFEDRLHRFLIEEKGLVLLQSVKGSILRTITEAILMLELEINSLQMPVKELEDRLSAFEEKGREIELEKEDFSALLEVETKKIIQDILEPDLDKAKEELAQSIMPEFEEFYRKRADISVSRLRQELEGFITDRIRQYYMVFRKNEDTKIFNAFENICNRFIKRIDEIIDSLLKYSSELFSLGFESFDDAVAWKTESSFYYSFRDETLMIEMLGNALTTILPSFLSRRLVFNSMKTHLTEMIDRQAGRIRWDFVERLQKCRLDFRWEMSNRIDEVIKRIKDAIESGMARKGSEEKGIEETKKLLIEKVNRLKEIKAGLLQSLESSNP